MLLLDGVRYFLWTPQNEENEFHPMIIEHSKDIFGEDTLYFDIKKKLKSKSGIGSIPDAYLINPKTSSWSIIENELSSHSIMVLLPPQSREEPPLISLLPDLLHHSKIFRGREMVKN